MTDLEFQRLYERFSGNTERQVLGLVLDTCVKKPTSLELLAVTYMSKIKGHDEISYDSFNQIKCLLVSMSFDHFYQQNIYYEMLYFLLTSFQKI